MAPDHDLAHAWHELECAEAASDRLLSAPGDPQAGQRIGALTEVVRDAMQHESDREANLNARGAAVASVAAVIVAASSAVGKSVLDESKWSDDRLGQGLAIVLFLVAVTVIAVAMAVAVVGVLRPKRGPVSRIFLAQELGKLSMTDVASLVAPTGEDARLLYVEKSLRTLPRWYYRNRIKARWLRRSYVLLTLGVALVGLAGVVVLSHEADFPLEWSIIVVAVTLAAAWAAVEKDLVGAVTVREPKESAAVTPRQTRV